MEISFQKIYEIISPSLPKNWERIVLFVAIIHGRWELNYFVKVNEKRLLLNRRIYKDCSSLGLNYSSLRDISFELQKEIVKNYDFLEEKKKWSGLTIEINSNGDFNSTFEYSRENVEKEDYFDSWKNQYLK